MCKIWYLISRTVSEDDAHRGNTIARSALGFALHGRCRNMCPLEAIVLCLCVSIFLIARRTRAEHDFPPDLVFGGDWRTS